jgi:N-acetylneuraminate synthase/N,N'-diacetyllegionaminate synthase
MARINDFLKNGTFVIAEAGVNHNKDLELAFKLVDAAKEAKADAVKFQTFITEKSISRLCETAPYQKAQLGEKTTQFEMAKALELSFDDFARIKKYCDQKQILFLSTPDEIDSLEFLIGLDMPLIKIGSGEITNVPLLEALGKSKRPVILSTGASTLQEVNEALNVIYKEGNKEVALLHCVSEYPAPIEEVNLKAIQTLQNSFNLPVGFSDHTLGFEATIAAVALGAQIIEKHFTLDQSLPGPDHKASLDPKQLKELVQKIRNIEKALGDGLKKPAPCEAKNIQLIRRSLVLERDIKAGEAIQKSDLSVKKPGYGVSPSELDQVVGRKSKRFLKKDEVLTWDALQ